MIIFSHVTQQYVEGEQPVYEDFSEEIRDGEFVVLTGENGSGKTTFIRLVLKEVEPASGSIVVNGQEITTMDRRNIPFYRRKIGVIFQDFCLMQDLTVYDNLAAAIMATGGGGREAEKKIAHVLSMIGADHLHKRYPGELSGGEQQKICLARAVLNDPGILLADEPAGNLDPESSAELNRLLGLIHDQGTTVIMATHDMEAANAPGRRRIDLKKNNGGHTAKTI